MALRTIFSHVFIIILYFSGAFPLNGNGQIPHPHPLQCRNDDHCTKNSVCEKDQYRCKCSDGYVVSGNMTTCLKVASSYADACEEHRQCSSYLSVGGTCSNGKCVCSTGFHYLHGYCYRTSELGETCLSADHCYVNHESKAATCENDKCQCSDNYYQREYRSCRRAAQKIGDECAIDHDCRFDRNATCNKSKRCQLETSGTLSHQELNYYSGNTLKESVGAIGKPCNATVDCNSIEAAICSALKLCVCDRAHFLSKTGNKCIAELGEPCTTDHTPEIKDSSCRDGRWGCKGAYVALNGNRECRKATTKYNTSCQLDEQCLIFGSGALCSDKRKCICNDKSHYVEKHLFCWMNRGLGESCKANEDCYVKGLDIDLHCNVKLICSCPEGSHISSDQSVCIRNNNALGGLCTEDKDCSINNSICSNRSCVCADNYYESNGLCLRGISGSCKVDNDCRVSNAVCQNHTCTCNDGHVGQSVSLCVPVASHGSGCNYDIQCSAEISNSICTSTTPITRGEHDYFNKKVDNGTCTCTKGYYYNYDNCFKRRVLKEACQTIGECYIESSSESVLCKNGICSCNFGWRAVNDSHCESGATAISNSMWVLLIAVYTLYISQCNNSV